MSNEIPATPVENSRIARAGLQGAEGLVRRLVSAAQRGLPLAYDECAVEFAQTVRRTGPGRSTVRREGVNLRYAAMAALGINRLGLDDQRTLFSGNTAASLATTIHERALNHDDPGAVALAAWAAAEISDRYPEALFDRLHTLLKSGQPLATVDVSWMLTAATVAGGEGVGGAVAELAAARLLAARGSHGIFPHILPAGTQNRWRRHVGSFADQVYPIQALARMFALTHDRAALDAAEATAARICELQGSAGQWWWHYDIRTGQVVEGFPVYSVHQHAMAPMVLFDLAEAGGTDHLNEVVAGLRWIDNHPEVDGELLEESLGLIWRKVGRREPAKAARKAGAVVTAIRPGSHIRGLGRILPATQIDYECRPYELGWLLYAWLPPRGGRHV